MRKLLSLALLGVLAASVVQAENFTQKNTDKAKAIIAAAVEAHGGDALLEDLQTLVIEHEAINHSVDQSRGTDAPWDTAVSEGVDAIDLGNNAFITTRRGNGGGFESNTGTIINGDHSYQLDFRAGTVARISDSDYDAASGPFVRVTPALLLRTLKNREANAHFLGKTAIDDVTYNVVGFSMTVGPALSLYFEDGTNLLRRSERIFPGFGLVEYRFDNYADKDGVPYNQSFTLLLNGDVNAEREIKSVRINEPLAELLEVPPTLVSIPEIQPDPLARQVLADGVWLIGGNGTYAMFVDMGDYIFAAGGTAGIPERIELLREVVGKKPIRYGMLTHHHFDHVLGVTAYEEEGAIVVAAKSHERIARRAAADGERLEMKLVDKEMKLEANGRRIEIIDIGPTAHTEHLLVAWLPEEGILFEADHFAVPSIGPVPPAVSSTRTFAKALARTGLEVKQFVSAHSPKPGTRGDLDMALHREEHQARR
jgi:glyoxylase-like metal-dependent hydrolase (beta-lactamase superfamily II)